MFLKNRQCVKFSFRNTSVLTKIWTIIKDICVGGKCQLVYMELPKLTKLFCLVLKRKVQYLALTVFVQISDVYCFEYNMFLFWRGFPTFNTLLEFLSALCWFIQIDLFLKKSLSWILSLGLFVSYNSDSESNSA